MERDQATNQPLPNEHGSYDEAENMDRAAQSGSEGAFGEDNPNSNLEDLRRDAEAAFGNADDSGATNE